MFRYHPAIVERFPGVVGGIILARGMHNAPTPGDLQEKYAAEQQAVLRRLGDTPLSQIESLAAWRAAFRGFNVDPTQYRSAAEALLRRLTKKGDIPSIHMLVDIGNLVSIRYALPVAVVDMRRLSGGITVHFAQGDEPFIPLGETTPEYPEPGEVIFTDEARAVHARRWCWRQSDPSAARLETTDAIITVETHHPGGRVDIDAAVKDLLALLAQYAGGQYEQAILDAARLAV